MRLGYILTSILRYGIYLFTPVVALLGIYLVSSTIYRHYQLSLQPLVIVAGSKSAAYYKLSSRYAQFLVSKGVRVKVCETSGSVEILRKLTGADAPSPLSCQSWEPGASQNPVIQARETVEAMAGFVQGGLSDYAANLAADAKGKKLAEVASLGRVIVEPLWIYYRCPRSSPPSLPLSLRDVLSQAQGGRQIVIGRRRSGTEDLMNKLIRAHGGDATIGRRNLIEAGQVRPDGSKATADENLAAAMRDPSVVAYATVGAQGLPGTEMFSIDRSYLAKEICLLDFAGSHGLVQQLPFLSMEVIHRGAFSLPGDVPERDLTLLTTRAAFVIKDTVNPVLKNLLAEAILKEKTESKMESFFFPLPAKSLEEDDLEYKKSEEALHVYRSEQGFFQRNLPFFWVATYLDTFILYLVALPFIGMIWPVFRVLPAAQEFLAKRRLNNMHRGLSRLEADIRAATSPQQLDRYETALERETAFISRIPLPEADRFSLRRHIELVGNALSSSRAKLPRSADVSSPLHRAWSAAQMERAGE